MYETNRCALCSRTEDEHRQLEANGALNHKYSETGNLTAVDRSTPRRQPTQEIPRVIGAIDLELRRILLKKGIINNEDFAALRDPGIGAVGDRSPGSEESTD